MRYKGWLFRVTDLISFSFAVILAFYFRFFSDVIPVFTEIPDLSLYLKAIVVLSPFYVLLLGALGNYQPSYDHLSEYEIHNLFRSLGFFYVMCAAITFFVRSFEFSRLTLGLAFFINFLLCVIFRILIGKQVPRRETNVMLIGKDPELLREVRRAFEEKPHLGQVVCEETEMKMPDFDIDRIIVVGGELSFSDLADLVLKTPSSILVDLIPSYHVFLRELPFRDSIGVFPILPLNRPVFSGWHSFGKRLMDISVAAVLLLSLSPLILLTAMAVRLFYGSPVFFRQIRVGQNGKLFTIYKFRTMKLEAEQQIRPILNSEKKPNYKKKDDFRVLGKFAQFLRRTSLDELPQFWNVLQGSMSLVGPRPAPADFVQNYSSIHKMRFAIQPGITGLQQVMCRGTESMEDILQYDLKYIREQSLWLDLMILIKTIPAVVLGKGSH